MKTKLISLRISEEDHAAILAASVAANRSMSEHLRRSALDSTTTPRSVPPLNRLAWQELAAPLNNLNQIARAFNRFGLHIRENGLTADGIRSIFELLEITRADVVALHEQIHALRRDLFGAAPLEAAAATLENFASASNTRRLPVSRERLQATADELRELGLLLGEVAP